MNPEVSSCPYSKRAENEILSADVVRVLGGCRRLVEIVPSNVRPVESFKPRDAFEKNALLAYSEFVRSAYNSGLNEARELSMTGTNIFAGFMVTGRIMGLVTVAYSEYCARISRQESEEDLLEILSSGKTFSKTAATLAAMENQINKVYEMGLGLRDSSYEDGLKSRIYGIPSFSVFDDEHGSGRYAQINEAVKYRIETDPEMGVIRAGLESGSNTGIARQTKGYCLALEQGSLREIWDQQVESAHIKGAFRQSLELV